MFNMLTSDQKFNSPFSFLKCYSLIFCGLCGWSAKNLGFWLICIVLVPNDKKQEILQSRAARTCLFLTAKFVWLIIRSDNIFNIEVIGALAIHINVHNSRKIGIYRLKFWISDSYVDTGVSEGAKYWDDQSSKFLPKGWPSENLRGEKWQAKK